MRGVRAAEEPVGGDNGAEAKRKALASFVSEVTAFGHVVVQTWLVEWPYGALNESDGIEEVDSTASERQFEQIAVLQAENHSALCRFGRDVSNRCPIGNAGIATVAN